MVKKATPAATPTSSVVKKATPTTPVAQPLTLAQATPTRSTVVSAEMVKKKEGVASAKKEGKKEKKGLFANFRKKLKSGGKSEEVKGVSVKSDVVKSEEVKREEVKSEEREKGAPGAVGGSVGEEEDEEQERQEFYKAIGYSEDEEYVEFPREVSGTHTHTHTHTRAFESPTQSTTSVFIDWTKSCICCM